MDIKRERLLQAVLGQSAQIHHPNRVTYPPLQCFFLVPSHLFIYIIHANFRCILLFLFLFNKSSLQMGVFRPVTIRNKVDFPVYGLDFTADDILIAGGGGGANRSGVKNNLVCC